MNHCPEEFRQKPPNHHSLLNVLDGDLYLSRGLEGGQDARPFCDSLPNPAMLVPDGFD
jgi:hypothetical protein